MSLRIPALSLLTAVALTATGCSSGPNRQAAHAPTGGASLAATSGAGGVQHVTIHSTDKFRFDPAVVSAHTGTLDVTLVDDGSYPHNIAVSSLHVTSDTVSGGLGKKTTDVTFKFDHAGTYRFVCTFHSTAGMVGEFDIS